MKISLLSAVTFMSLLATMIVMNQGTGIVLAADLNKIPYCSNEAEMSNIVLFPPVQGEAFVDWIPADLQDFYPEKEKAKDYRGGDWVYDGHTGSDFAIVGFPAMDKGVYVLAAADGTVSQLADGKWDRNLCAAGSYPIGSIHCSARSPNDPGNFITIEHENSWSTAYKHLRKNSLLVKKGQQVWAGQPIAQVGSSGISSGPHLHFEVRKTCKGANLTPEVYAVDPFYKNLWGYTISYPGNSLHVVTKGVSKGPPGDSMYQPPPPNISKIKVGQEQAGDEQEKIHVWFYVVGPTQLGDRVFLEIIHPNGKVHDQLPQKVRSDRVSYLSIWFNVENLAEISLGTWKVILKEKGVAVSEVAFTLE